MKNREFKTVWVMGLVLCAGAIWLCKTAGADLVALIMCVVILVCLSFIKNEEGNTLYDIVGRRIKP